MSARTVFHRPVPGGRRGWNPLCGHRFGDGRYCGAGVYEFRHPTGRWYWKHYPSDTMRRPKDAMPDGWEAFPPVHVVRGLRPILGPLPCISCGRLVVWATYTAVIPEPRRRESHVRTRALLGWDGLERHSCGRAS